MAAWGYIYRCCSKAESRELWANRSFRVMHLKSLSWIQFGEARGRFQAFSRGEWIQDRNVQNCCKTYMKYQLLGENMPARRFHEEIDINLNEFWMTQKFPISTVVYVHFYGFFEVKYWIHTEKWEIKIAILNDSIIAHVIT